MTVIKYLLCAVLAYLLGSISTGVLVSRALFHDDVRQHGSGGTGATNMLRTYRLKVEAIIRMLKTCGYTFVTFDELADLIESK